MRRWASVALLAATALVSSSCEDADRTYARAVMIESLDQAIGGPKASAREGDFLLENDQIKVVVEQGGSSYTPLGKGGSIIDIDLNRHQREYRSGHGLDQVGQFVPVANLYQADAFVPANVKVTPSREGAEVTVAAEGSPILPLVIGLTSLLHQRYTDRPQALNLYTEYEVRPGERMVRITTTIGYDIRFCPVGESDDCPEECADALYDSDCECPAAAARCLEGVEVQEAAELPDRDFGGILGVLTGDFPQDGGRCVTTDDCDGGETCIDVTQSLGGELRVCRGPDARDSGVLLGDMLIFAKDTDAFFRGPGFDTESDIRRLFDAGYDTLQTPLEIDTIYAIGDGVSYGYTAPHGTMLVPVLSGPFSMGAPAAASCPTDNPGCLNNRLVRFERWLSVGEGDVSSASVPIAAARGDELGRVAGVVVERPSGQPVSGAKVFALADPRELPCEGACADECDLGGVDDDELAAMTLEEVLAANRCRTRDEIFLGGKGGIESMAVSDPVGDSQRDGGYQLALPPGRYVLVAQRGFQRSSLGAVEVRAGKTAKASFSMAEPARLDYAILDDTGQPAPGRIAIGQCMFGPTCTGDDDCSGGDLCQQGACTCERQLPVPLEFGGGRLIDGIMSVEHARDGVGSMELPAGEYDVVFSRGPDYSIDDQVVTVQSGRATTVEGRIARVVDRAGWATSDFHVHAAPSLDSDVSLEERVNGMIANDMDHFVATDHDTITDYRPLIQALDVRRFLGTDIGVEVSTNDLGHFIGFPLAYQEWTDGVSVPGNGAPDWHQVGPLDVFDQLRALDGDEGRVVIQVPHPYGYFDAYRIDPVTLEPVDSFLTVINPLAGPSNFSGEFDAFEIMNSKNYDLLRRPTLEEARFFSTEFDALRTSLRAGELDSATYDRRLFQLMTEAARRMMHRTVAEQDAAIEGVGGDIVCTCGADGDCAPGLVCDPALFACVEPPLPPDPVLPPDVAMCRSQRGMVDDWFLMLNRGVVKTGLSGSDVHDEEAGTIRTFLRTGPVSQPNLDSEDITRAVTRHRAVVSTAPMIDFRVSGAEVGDMLDVSSGDEVELSIRIQKAPWYDLDRVEVYRNGRLIHWASGCDSVPRGDEEEPHGHPCLEAGDGIVAYEDTITDSPEEDSWYAVIAFGIDGRSLSPIYRSVGLPRLGTGEITQKLYDLIPLLRGFRVPRAATQYPMFPWAITNPIWVDVGADGWDPLEPPPSWCRDGIDHGC